MQSRFNNRFIVFLALLLVCFLFLVISYGILMRDRNEPGQQETAKSLTRTVEISGMRGSILDCNGIPLAYDTEGYDLNFLIDASKKGVSSEMVNYTEIFRKTIEIVEKNGGKTIDSFLIKRDETGEYKFDLDFLVKDETDTEGLKRRQARIDNWCSNMQISDPSAEPEQMYNELRSRYRIPENVEYEEAIKILSIWQEVQLGFYRAYLPVTIAENVSYSTVIEIELKANELSGMQISRTGVRVYPKGDLAAHIIGYTGAIMEEDDLDDLKQKGYDPDNDLIGKTGLEYTMEQYLTASTSEKKGSQIITVTNNMEIDEVLSYSPPKNGDTVVSTINIKMQEVLTEALQNNIDTVREEQELKYEQNKAYYDKKVQNRKDQQVNMCDSGAAVVIDVNNADILAMVSLPSYDLNLFVGGISEEDYEELKNEPSSPFFNNAIQSASTPGSIFKICTAFAGLIEGEITANTIINDVGPYDKYVVAGKAPECWVEPYYSQHANGQTVIDALKVSCNYFFYEVADRLGIDKVNEWAYKFGLTEEKTGIELPAETVGRVGNQSVLYDNTKSINDQKSYTPLLVYNKIVSLLTEYGEERGVEYPEELIKETAEQILKLAGSEDGKTDFGKEIRDIMNEKMEIPTRVSRAKGWSLTINQYLNEIIWTSNDSVLQGIGVEPTQLSPIAVARFMAAVANGGEVLEPHIVDKVIDVDGNIVYSTEKEVIRDIDIPKKHLETVWEGLREVVSLEDGGGAANVFKNFEYNGLFVGKTGTGKVSDIDLENNAWFVCFAPFGENETPEIAVVVFLPNGSAGTNAAYTARDFLKYYFDSKNAVSEVVVPEEGTLVP